MIIGFVMVGNILVNEINPELRKHVMCKVWKNRLDSLNFIINDDNKKLKEQSWTNHF